MVDFYFNMILFYFNYLLKPMDKMVVPAYVVQFGCDMMRKAARVYVDV